ncbi:hypothetical protein AOLI_G00297790 [Acnodon oligacanthus]
MIAVKSPGWNSSRAELERRKMRFAESMTESLRLALWQSGPGHQGFGQQSCRMPPIPKPQLNSALHSPRTSFPAAQSRRSGLDVGLRGESEVMSSRSGAIEMQERYSISSVGQWRASQGRCCCWGSPPGKAHDEEAPSVGIFRDSAGSDLHGTSWLCPVKEIQTRGQDALQSSSSAAERQSYFKRWRERERERVRDRKRQRQRETEREREHGG